MTNIYIAYKRDSKTKKKLLEKIYKDEKRYIQKKIKDLYPYDDVSVFLDYENDFLLYK
jgi:hypothetical protein